MSVMEVVFLFYEMGMPVNEQTVRKWCREGTLNAKITHKHEGYVIDSESVEKLIEKKLKIKHKREIVFSKGYAEGFEDAKKLYKSIEKKKD